MKPKSCRFFCQRPRASEIICGVGFLVCFSSSLVLADDFSVKGSVVTGNWSESANWDNPPVIGYDELLDPIYGAPDGATANIIFSPTSGAPIFKLDDRDRTVNDITFSSSSTGQVIATNSGATFRTLTLNGNISNPGNSGQSFLLQVALTTGTHTVNSNANTIVFDGTLLGTGGLTVAASTSAGRVLLSGDNSFSGVTYLNSGKLQLDNFNALKNTTLETGSTGDRALVLKNVGTALNNSSFNIGGLSGNLNIVMDNTVVDGTGGSGYRSLSVGANNASTTYGGELSGTGRLYKVGTGTLNLTGANTYTGSTVVSAGRLAVNGSTSTTGVVSVSSGATLSGTGTVGGSTTINSGGTHAPGNSAGLETFLTNMTYKAGSIFEWELNSLVSSRTGGTEGSVVGQTAGTGDRGGLLGGVTEDDFDAVKITGNATIESGAIFKILLSGTYNRSDAFWNSRQVWSVFDVVGTKTTTFDTFHIYDSTGFIAASPTSYNHLLGPTAPGYFSFQYNTDTLGANSGNLIWSPVPEPTSALAGLLLGAGLLRRKRGRKG